jgi:DNA polymerase-3 subunit delta'
MQAFHEVITHTSHLKTLQSAIDRDAMPHAMLFWGNEGTGALAAAITVAQYLVCRDRSESGACGVCKGCIKSNKHMHPDIHYAFPTIGSKVTGDQLYPEWRAALSENPYMNRNQWLERIEAESKQGNINVEDIERIIGLLMLRPVEADCKILIMWLPEYLGKEGNRLLKLIEEPPMDSYIFLVAESRDDILPTILSRCQQFFFPPLSEELIAHGLMHQFQMDEQKAGWISAAAQGDWNTAIQIAQGVAINPIQGVQDWIKAAWSKDPGMISQWSEMASKYTREECKQLLNYILGLLEKVLWLKYGKDFEVAEEEKKLLVFLNKKIEQQELEQLVALCEENLRAIQQNANSRILWFHATLKLQKLLYAENALVQES